MHSVVIEGLWEEFRVAARPGSVKELLSRLRPAGGRRSSWALRDVDLNIHAGETLGLIGRNGSGKSTLLRCIAGILPPTKGSVLVSGPISSLIELGAGFHHELSGRENALVTGALFGIRRADLRRRMDEIVAFAELGHVIDQPVRSYSSGMVVRLAFSLAVHAAPSILLIDEVLAVGDEAFQRKCIDKVIAMKGEGMTTVFVSHNLPLVEKLCSRVAMLDSGHLVGEGRPPEMIDLYRSSLPV